MGASVPVLVVVRFWMEEFWRRTSGAGKFLNEFLIKREEGLIDNNYSFM